MKKMISLILVLIVCLSLCACGVSEGRIKEALTKGEWYSDRETNTETDLAANRTYNYNISFYDDGSYKLTYMSHTYKWAWKQDPEKKTETGTWSIDGKVVTLHPHGSGDPVNLTYSRDNTENKDILTGPQAEGGYTYYRYSNIGIG